MKTISAKRCIIGEGPIWNDREEALYYTNGLGREVCRYHFNSDLLEVIPVLHDCAAMAFDKDNKLIVSQADGVFFLNEDGTRTPIYDTDKYTIRYANDMKVGPDGCIYVGTQSEKRAGAGDKIDGKLYRIDHKGNVKLLLDHLRLSNGMEWSMDETRFYHTDSDTGVIREYEFLAEQGEILFTGRQSGILKGVDGFTIGTDNRLYATRWGKACVSILDLASMTVVGQIEIPCPAPASCCIAGTHMDKLVVTTASLNLDTEQEKEAGFTFVIDGIPGRKPYRYRQESGSN